MSNEQVAPETKGVTAKLLATVDLGPEIEGMAGRQLRMRITRLPSYGKRYPLEIKALALVFISAIHRISAGSMTFISSESCSVNRSPVNAHAPKNSA
jgi:hypothetical protein